MEFCCEIRCVDMSICSALSKEIPQGKRCLDSEALSGRHRALKNLIFRCPGLRSSGLGLPHQLRQLKIGNI